MEPMGGKVEHVGAQSGGVGLGGAMGALIALDRSNRAIHGVIQLHAGEGVDPPLVLSVVVGGWEGKDVEARAGIL